MRKYPEPTSEALIESALKNVDILDRHNFPDFKVSVKASEVFMAVAAYRGLAQQIEQPLHQASLRRGSTRWDRQVSRWSGHASYGRYRGYHEGLAGS